jgi:hypothetical protein
MRTFYTTRTKTRTRDARLERDIGSCKKMVCCYTSIYAQKGYPDYLNAAEALLNPNTIGIGDLTLKVQSADRLFERGALCYLLVTPVFSPNAISPLTVRGPQEATLDSAFLLTASNLGAAKARQMRSDIGGFDIDDFVSRLVTFMGGRRQTENMPTQDNEESFDIEGDEGTPLEWDKIGRKALAKSRRLPAMEFM